MKGAVIDLCKSMKYARRIKDSHALFLLKGLWEECEDFYRLAGYCPVRNGVSGLREVCKVIDSGPNSEIFENCLHPIFEENQWYRGYAIPADLGHVIVLTDWVIPGEGSPSLSPRLYAIGNVKARTIEHIMKIFCISIYRYILKCYREFKNRGQIAYVPNI